MKLPRLTPEPGPIQKYMSQLPVKERRACEAAIKNIGAMPEGVILLELLDNSTINRTVPIAGEPRALDALNAQSLIAHDLRRIMSDDDGYIGIGQGARLEHK